MSAGDRRIKIGFVFPQMEIGPDPSVAVRFAEEVEAAGFHYLLIFDHVLGADPSTRPGWVGAYCVTDQFHEPFVFLSYLAARTGLHFMTGVLVLPQRQTVLVAKQATELDVLSGGRLRLGVGIGWNGVEYEGLGVDFADRGRRLEEQIELMRLLWASEAIDYTGRYHRVDRAGILPRPEAGTIPIWIGTFGTNHRVLKRIARVADGWNPLLKIDELESSLNVIAEEAERIGRDPSQIRLEGRIRVVPDDTPDSVVRQVQQWEEAGADYVAVDTLHWGLSPDDHFARMTELGAALSKR